MEIQISGRGGEYVSKHLFLLSFFKMHNEYVKQKCIVDLQYI